jgi:hypothetical protein
MVWNCIISPRFKQCGNKLSLQRVMKVWKEIVNLTHQRGGLPTNVLAQVVQMIRTINAILEVWVAQLELIVKDILDICKI